jgi:enolase
MTVTIQELNALEILDSRGRPTVQATCVFSSGVSATASIPSGASTGAAEAHELRDGDRTRYRGLGCRKAVANIRGEINESLRGRSFGSQAELDRALIELDGTLDKSRLGANAVLAVSIVFARACALEQKTPLYQYFAGEQTLTTLPRPMINLFSGGKHAGGQIAIQDVQVMPMTTRTMDDTLAMTVEVFQAAADLIFRKYGLRLLTADEGGLAPNFADSEEMLATAVEAIELAGLVAGRDVVLTVDVASSHFYEAGVYHLGDKRLDGSAMIERLMRWLDSYPIVSLEDGLAEDDWEHWAALREVAAGRALVLGDDLLCTNPARIQQAIERRAVDALLLKVNQIGTLTEAAQSCQMAKAAGWKVVVSARSGETEDHWLADLAVGWLGDHIKVGSITQSERLAKYNRLLAIEAEMGLPLAGSPGG